MIEEADLALLDESEQLPGPKSWSRTFAGEPMPNWVEILRRQRGGHK